MYYFVHREEKPFSISLVLRVFLFLLASFSEFFCVVRCFSDLFFFCTALYTSSKSLFVFTLLIAIFLVERCFPDLFFYNVMPPNHRFGQGIFRLFLLSPLVFARKRQEGCGKKFSLNLVYTYGLFALRTVTRNGTPPKSNVCRKLFVK